MTEATTLAATAQAAPGSLIFWPGQVEWRGLLMGEETPYCRDALSGWEDLPGVDIGNAKMPRRHGSWPGSALGQERVVTLDLVLAVEGGTTAALRAALVRATTIRDDAVEEPLVVCNDEGVVQLAWGQIVRRVIPLSAGYRKKVHPSLQWVCSDPRRYSLVEHHASTKLPTPPVVLPYPVGYPIEWPAAGSSGSTTAENTGSEPTPGRYLFTGPAVRPRTTVRWPSGLRRTMWLDLELAAGEWVEADARAGTVLLMGTASRSGKVRGALLEEMTLAPGVNQITYRAESSTDPDAAELDVAWRDADM